MMKLRLLGVGVAGLASLAIACGSSGDNGDDDSDSGSAGNPTGAAGAPIAPPGGTAGSANAGAANPSAGAPALGGAGGRAPSLGGSSGAASTAGTGTGGTPTLCDPETEPLVCVDATNVRGCSNDGVVETLACPSLCEDELRLAPGGCVSDAEGTGCDCGDPLNAECFTGADAVCACGGCTTSQEFFEIYLTCDDGMNVEATTAIRCFAEQVTEDAAGVPTIDCMAAEAECLPAATP